MTSLAAAIAALEPVDDGGWRGAVPENWLQGRTAYGGFSSALALAVAQRSDEDLPPLRSAQVAFVGPLAGTVLLRARRLRRGRTAAWIQVDVESEAGLGLRATMVFMAERPSQLDYAPAAAPSTDDTPTLTPPPALVFTRNFDFVDSLDAPPGPAEWLRWVRLRERSGLDPAVELMAVADALPPAAIKLIGRPVPLSSMTWQIDLLGVPGTIDGWYLLGSATDHARAGFSSQRMAIWDRDRRPVAAHMQGVALFA